MIQSLKIKNFQSHKDSILEFDPGVNVIIGKSDSGKTALLRALRWLIWNRPSGDAFRSDWGGNTEVVAALTVPDLPNPAPIIITRRRDKKDEYVLLNKEQVGYTAKSIHKPYIFTAFGTNVPEEIRKAINFAEINLQKQFDQPFLITATPSEVAAHFNKVAKLDKIDKSLQNINKWIREIESSIKFKDAQIVKNEDELKQYDHLDKIEAEVEVLENLEKEHIKQISSISSLESLCEEIRMTNEDIENASEILQLEKPVNDVLDLIYKKDGLEDGPIASINELLDEIDATEVNIEAAKDKLIELEKQFEDEFPDICPLCGKPK